MRVVHKTQYICEQIFQKLMTQEWRFQSLFASQATMSIRMGPCSYSRDNCQASASHHSTSDERCLGAERRQQLTLSFVSQLTIPDSFLAPPPGNPGAGGAGLQTRKKSRPEPPFTAELSRAIFQYRYGLSEIKKCSYLWWSCSIYLFWNWTNSISRSH